MEIIQINKGDALILAIKGRLDAVTSAELESSAIALIDSGNKKLILDFSNLDYISSAGLRVLLLIAKKMKSSGGSVALASMKEFIKEVFEISGFISIFQIADDVDKAVTLL
ncbi:MAG: hypothetical protein QG635_645 [Bacteroidota bacterium]|nr:hypothetical protein [Bacteroidota bacterium]